MKVMTRGSPGDDCPPIPQPSIPARPPPPLCSYCISLSHALHLPSPLRASSCRPAASCWVKGSLSVDLGSWLRQVAVWSAIMAAKWAFEFYLVARPLASEVDAGGGGAD